MTVRKIITYPDPILSQKAEPVTEFDSELSELLDDMVETLYDQGNGIGLAAPQIAVSKRITIIDLDGTGEDRLELINPEIIEKSGTACTKEGCLSVPDFWETVTRAAWIKVRAFERSGEEYEFEAEDLLSICVQHELDHLDGVLFIDRLSRIKKDVFKRWFKKRGSLG